MNNIKYSSTLDFITAMMCMNNDCNYDNPALGRKIAESLNWFSKYNDVLEKYLERQINLKRNKGVINMELKISTI